MVCGKWNKIEWNGNKMLKVLLNFTIHEKIM